MAIWDQDTRNLIDYRLDARYDHWLLDEFQDTSQPQWKAIGSLIDEILQDTEGERSVFVVGDSKQSIYGWRGGEPRLFDDLKNYYGERLAEWEMDKSFRSSQNVLDLVNQVCELSDKKWRGIFPEAALDRWQFHPHQPSDEKLGHAMVIESLADPKATSDEKTNARYEVVKSLLEKTKPLERQQSCAILVTKNNQVTGMVEYLRRELPNLPVAPDLETLVADGPEGAVFLDFFRWLSHPADDFARLHVSYSPLREIVEELTNHEDASEQWHWLTDEISKRGVESLVENLVQKLRERVDLSDYGDIRLDEILRAASDFSAVGGSLDEWVTLLESRKIRESSREGMIQVMTVHKSKGLGFDVVILPELGGQTFAATNQLEMLERKGDLGNLEFIIRKPAKEICQADDALQSMMDSWEAEQCHERFCNLYVALTRAKQATYCVLDQVNEKWSPSQKFDDWIREATASYGTGEIEIGEKIFPLLFESGHWLESATQESPEILTPEPVKLNKPKPRLSRKVASADKGVKVGSLLEGGKGVNLGNMVHHHFEKITWIDEMPDLDDHYAAKLVKECLEIPEIRELFVRPNTEFQLLREQPIETHIQGAWLSGVIDRAVLFKENGKVKKISIIDYKTDQKDAIELREAYSAQLHLYRAAMARITQVPKESIFCHLLSTHLKQVVDV